MGQLDGKVVVLSGGASDIGRATALRLASEGAAVAVGDVSLDGAASVAQEVTAAGGQALGLVCDVRREESVADLVRAAAETFGGIDCVDHNAAWSHPRLDTRRHRRGDRRVGPHHRDHDARGAAPGPPRHPVHGRAGRWLHRHHLVGHEHHRRIRPGGLRRVQGRPESADPTPGRALRPRGHPGQRHRARASS